MRAYLQLFNLWGIQPVTLQYTCGPFHYRGLTLIPALMNDYIHYKMWDEITYPFLNFNGATVEVWEWITNSISHFTGQVITYQC